jgi:hypothetical protein
MLRHARANVDEEIQPFSQRGGRVVEGCLARQINYVKSRRTDYKQVTIRAWAVTTDLFALPMDQFGFLPERFEFAGAKLL